MRSIAAIAVFAALVAASAASEKVAWEDLKVTWNALGPLAAAASSGFYTMPKTAAAAKKEGWVEAKKETYVTVWCLPRDPRVCLIFDLKGTIAGIQNMYPEADMASSPYKYMDHPLFFQDTILGTKVAGGRAYFVSQDVLKSGGRASMGTEVGTGLWLKSGTDVIEVPQDGSKLEALGWTKENCIPTMGRHYYYNTTTDMDCQRFEPFFILTDNSKDWVKGFGFQAFGKRSKESRDWQENVPGIAIKPTIPTAPQCLVDWADNYGVLSIHTYFTKWPQLYIC